MSEKRKLLSSLNPERRKLLLRTKIECLFPKATIVQDPLGKEKMFEVILDFVRPILMIAEVEDTEAVITLGVMAWNVSLLPKRMQRRAMRELKSELFLKLKLDVVSTSDFE